MEEEQDSKWTNFAEILPNNERTAEIMKKREEKEELLRVKQLEMKQLQENAEKKKKAKERSEAAERMRKEKQAKDFEAKKREEEEQLNKLEGKMVLMLLELQNAETPFEYTLSGLDLGPVRCRILATHVAHNDTLLSLHLSRKNIQDNEGKELAKMLLTNNTLRKLELEGNNLTIHSAYAFGRALRVNKSLKYLDLESNQLTNDGTNWGGVTSLFEFLPVNKTLLSLNLANN